MAKQNPYDAVQQLIQQYQAEPDSFSTEQIQQIQQAAQQLGIDFSPQEDFGRLAKNFAFEAADTASFGLLPDELFGMQIKPDSVTTGDKVAGGLGGLLGFFTSPFAIGAKAATAGARGMAKLAAGGEIGLGKAAAKYFGKAEAKMGSAAAKAAMGVPTKGVATATGAAQKAFSATRSATFGALEKGGQVGKKVAEFAGKHPTLTHRAIQYGVASGAADLGNDIGDGQFSRIVGRTFGGAIAGGVGAGVGALGNMAAGVGKLAGSVGAQQAVRIAVAGIWGNMTAPEKSAYPKEYVEEFVKNAIMAYR